MILSNVNHDHHLPIGFGLIQITAGIVFPIAEDAIVVRGLKSSDEYSEIRNKIREIIEIQPSKCYNI